MLCHPPRNSSLNTLGPRHPHKRRTTKASFRGQVPETGTEQRCRGCSSARPQQAPGCCAFTSVAELLLLFESSSSYLTCSNSAFQRETTTLHIFEDSFLTHQSLLFSRPNMAPRDLPLQSRPNHLCILHLSERFFPQSTKPFICALRGAQFNRTIAFLEHNSQRFY